MLLTKVKKIGITNDKLDMLLYATVDFIMSHEFSDDNIHKKKSFFPQFSLESNYKIYHSRLGWCYGDLGIAISLWEAGCALNIEELKSKAVTIFKYSFKRKNLIDTFVVDACFCHGSSGISIMSQRMYLNTDDLDFLTNAKYWVERTLNYSKNEGYPVGFKFWSGRDSRYICNNSLLGGLAGVGLSLLSFLKVSNEYQSWYECLLLS